MAKIQVALNPKAVYRQNSSRYWWVRFRHRGRQVRLSTGEANYEKAYILATRIYNAFGSKTAQVREAERELRKAQAIYDRAAQKLQAAKIVYERLTGK